MLSTLSTKCWNEYIRILVFPLKPRVSRTVLRIVRHITHRNTRSTVSPRDVARTPVVTEYTDLFEADREESSKRYLRGRVPNSTTFVFARDASDHFVPALPKSASKL